MMRSIGPSCRCRRPSARRRCCGGVLMPCASRQGRATAPLAKIVFGRRACSRDDLVERPHLVDMAAERGVIVEAQGEFDRRDDGGRRHIAEGVFGHQRDVDHEGDAAARPYGDRRAARGHGRQRLTHRAREPHGVIRNAGAQRASGARHEEDRAERRLTILADALDRFAQGFRAAPPRPGANPHPADRTRIARRWSRPSASSCRSARPSD